MLKEIIIQIKEEIDIKKNKKLKAITNYKTNIYIYKEDALILYKKGVTLTKENLIEITNIAPQEIEGKLISGKHKNYYVIIDKNDLVNFEILS